MKNQFMMISMKNVVLAAMAIMAIGACGSKETSEEKSPIVDVVTVKDINEVSTTTFTGKTKAASEVTLAFRVAGGGCDGQARLSGAVGCHAGGI